VAVVIKLPPPTAVTLGSDAGVLTPGTKTGLALNLPEARDLPLPCRRI